MPRAKKADINTLGRSNFVDWNVKRLIDEAANVGRWNPPLSLEWYNEASQRLDAFSDDYEYYNKSAKATNKYWIKMETYQWFDKNDYWGKSPIKRVPILGE